MVGSAIVRLLSSCGYKNLITRASSELDLRNQTAVETFFAREKPEVVILAAARVGGILANNEYPYQFLYDNMAIQSNVINVAHEQQVDRLVFLGSSCIYPKYASQPLKEDYLLTGPLEPTNQWYAVAKIAGIKLCEALRKQYGRHYISLMPTNLYGPNDNFDLETSHVLPALIRKFHESKQTGKRVQLWGTGSPMREFLHVDDMARATLFCLENELDESMYNVGTGKDISIKKLAELIRDITGSETQIEWDTSKPDGTPRKLLDVSKMAEAGWTYNIELEEGIRQTYNWYREHENKIKEVRIDG